MKSVQLITAVSLLVLLTACGGKQKKVIVMATGDLKVEGSNITIEPGMSYKEQELIFTDAKPTLSLKTTTGVSKSLELTGDGIYVLNLQNDTLIGGAVNYGKSGVPGSITSEQMDKMIDSTIQLMEGKNVSDEKKTFFIPPYTIKKVSNEGNAVVISSFKAIPYSVEPDKDGKIPDVIKFFTNKQKRETLRELQEQRNKLQGSNK